MATTNPPQEIEVRTRFGHLARSDVYLPDGPGPFPTLLAAAPYLKELAHLPTCWTFAFRETGPIDFYLGHGYAYVFMDLPGTGRSEGNWDLVSREEGLAIHDVIEDIATRPWSNGKVGMIGQSAFCWSQWNAARTRPPHLTTIAPFDGAVDMYRDWMYHGGIPTVGFLGQWYTSILLRHVDQGYDVYGGDRYKMIVDIFAHGLDDEWHRRRSPYWELGDVDIPVLSIGCWGKAGLHLRGNILGFNEVTGPKQLLLMDVMSFPAAQEVFEEPQFHEEELLPWYDHHLKGIDNGVMDRPTVRYRTPRTGRERTATVWPPSDVEVTTYYLSGEHSGAVSSLNDGSLVDSPPTSEPTETSFTFPDPKWLSGTTTYAANGEVDHVARTNTFASVPFTEATEFTGNGVLTLYCSTDQTDLDVAAKLSVVPDDGDNRRARRVSAGWLRASHREVDPSRGGPLNPFHSHERLLPVVPGEVYELAVELLPMSFVAEPGERLRLEICNNDSRALDYLGISFRAHAGRDTYHHSTARPSRLQLHRRPPEGA